MTVELKVEQGLVAMGHQYHAYRGPLLVSDDFTEAEAVDYLRNHGEAKLYTSLELLDMVRDGYARMGQGFSALIIMERQRFLAGGR